MRNAGAPAALKSAELAHNEVDNTLYVGKGDDGSGNATSIVALGGSGAFADLSATQTIGGAKTFSIVPKSAQDASGATDLVRKSQFDTALSGKAATSHTHAVADVTGLQAALDGKLDDSQATAFGLSLLDDADAATARTTLGLGTAATSNSTAFAGASHSHAIGDVTGLQTALDGKAASSHAHAIGDVTGLQTALDGKAAASHSHGISDVTGLQTALDAKAPLASPVLSGTPKLVTLNNAAAITLTIPTNTAVAFPVGTRIDLLQYGAGQVTVGGSGVTIRSSGSKLKLAGQYSGATLWKRGTNEWVLIGDITT